MLALSAALLAAPCFAPSAHAGFLGAKVEEATSAVKARRAKDTLFSLALRGMRAPRSYRSFPWEILYGFLRTSFSSLFSNAA